MKLFDEWKAAQARLSDAIDAFGDMCIALEVEISRPGAKIGGVELLEHTLSEINTFLPSFESMSRRLCSAGVLMSQVRNISTNLVPIHKLPSEIFSQILVHTVVTSPCSILLSPGEASMLLNLQLVCTRWRGVMMNTAQVWSHVDIPDHPLSGEKQLTVAENTSTHLSRAAGSPLCLHFDRLSRVDYDDQMTRVLEHHFLKATSFVIYQESEMSIIESLFDMYACNGKLRSEGDPMLEEYGYSFRPLQQSAFYGLLHLQIGRVCNYLDSYDWEFLEHLLVVLSCNPSLYTLCLDSLPLSTIDKFDSLARVSLPRLELLHMPHQTNFAILLKIDPGPANLDLRIALPKAQDELVALKLFMQRSNVVSLSLSMPQSTRELNFLNSCLSLANNVRVLVIDIEDFVHTVHLSSIVSALLTGNVPTLKHTPTHDPDWSCSALLPNIKTLVISSKEFPEGKKMLQLLPIVWAYSLGQLVLVRPGGFEYYTPFEAGVLEWIKTRVECKFIDKDEEFGSGEPRWNSFMYQLYTS